MNELLLAVEEKDTEKVNFYADRANKLHTLPDLRNVRVFVRWAKAHLDIADLKFREEKSQRKTPKKLHCAAI